MTTIAEGHKRENPSDAFKADVPITSLIIATARNIHFIRVILSMEPPNVQANRPARFFAQARLSAVLDRISDTGDTFLLHNILLNAKLNQPLEF